GPMMNYLGLFYGVGALIIPLLAATISNLLSPAQIVLCAVALALGCAVVYALLRFPAARESQGFSLAEVIQVAAWPGVVALAVALFFGSADESVLLSFTPSYLASIGFDPAFASAGLTVFLAAFIVGRMVAGRVLRYVSKWQLVITAAFASLAAYALFLVLR